MTQCRWRRAEAPGTERLTPVRTPRSILDAETGEGGSPPLLSPVSVQAPSAGAIPSGRRPVGQAPVEIEEPGPGPRHRSGVLEILTVVAVMGALAALVVPRAILAAEAPHDRALKQDVTHLRDQILIYRAEHHGVAPGYLNGDPTQPLSLDAFTAQMTQYTDDLGRVSPVKDAAHHLGPYLARVPVNSINGSGEIRFLGRSATFPDQPVGAEGWLYQPSTGILAANVTGHDAAGTAYFDY